MEEDNVLAQYQKLAVSIQALQSELQLAIENQKFEHAASIRDQERIMTDQLEDLIAEHPELNPDLVKLKQDYNAHRRRG